jgi:hypothetical protein
VVPLFHGNSYLGSPFQKIPFTFTIPCLKDFPAPLSAFDVSQTFHAISESDVKRLPPPSRPQETPANRYIQGLLASVVKVKANF